jgi:hypothetical protein
LKFNNALDAVLFFITLTTVLSRMAVSLVTRLTIPLAGLLMGIAFDQAFA